MGRKRKAGEIKVNSICIYECLKRDNPENKTVTVSHIIRSIYMIPFATINIIISQCQFKLILWRVNERYYCDRSLIINVKWSSQYR